MTVEAIALRRVMGPVRRVMSNDFLRHSALLFIATSLVNFLNYVFNFALSRRLGVEGFATLSSLVSLLMILSIPTGILSLIAIKYAATYHAAGDAQRIRKLSLALLKWTSAASVAAFVAGMALRSQIGTFLHISDTVSIAFCIAIIAVGLITPSVRSILQGEQDFLRYSISALLETFLKLAAAVTLVYAGFGVRGAMLGWTAATICALAYTVWAVLKRHGVPAGTQVQLGIDLRRLLQTTAGVGLATAFLTCLSFMDVLLVKHYFDARQAGLYASVNLTGKVLLFLVAFVPAIVLPKAAAKTQLRENATPLLLQASALTLLLTLPILAIFAIVPAGVIRVLAGIAFVPAAPYVFQYDCAIALLAMLTLLVNYNIAIHRFAFLLPLGLLLIGEVTAIALYHRSLWDVVHVLIVGNALAVGACAGSLLYVRREEAPRAQAA
ncbi:MAG TPA: hypothetical protein VFE17_04535 [Candidatus Baltobacteraceae bacterium]|jgi:O-antigen/teichoic acid export membrane protein|nr:hypothetical protein [Candidatus Baltobacteraceae bacterium]